MPLAFFDLIFAIFSFLAGTCIGSFLNVCIYRMPRNLSVNHPKRSFCPHCQTQIAWRHNLPILGWLYLRGKCASCKVAISPRYLLVELLTGLLFLALDLRGPLVLLLPDCILMSLLLVATFIDLEFFIIPDEITWGGVGAGVILSAILPPMMGVESHWLALVWSVAGAACGYFLLWGVVEAGKLAFGRKKIDFGRLEPFRVTQEQEEPVLRVGEESLTWTEVFSRESDRMLLSVEQAAVNGKPVAATELVFFHDRLEIDGEKTPLAEVREVTGQVRQIVVPREAMGFGDVKFIAAIGAFLGWQAVLFTVPVAAVFGSVLGVGSMLIGRREWSAKIPFGPYLAAGAVLWMFAGPELVAWYLALARR